MEIIYLDKTNISKDIVIALGYFDGIHLGHKSVIEQMLLIAKDTKMKSSVFTFLNSPKSFFTNQDDMYLCSFDFKVKKLEEMGVDYLLVLPFDDVISNFSLNDFIDKIIVKNHVKHIVCGYDYRFGKNALGTTHELIELSNNRYNVSIVNKFDVDNRRVSSTLIKNHIIEGDIDLANQLLGYEYSIAGLVVKGKQRGRSVVGFATANIDYKNYVLPKKGVYAIKIIIDNKTYLGMANIGINPTFGDILKPTLEVHVFGFDQMIYGYIVQVEFYKKIRDEIKFESIDLLKEQLSNDHINILNYLKKEA